MTIRFPVPRGGRRRGSPESPSTAPRGLGEDPHRRRLPPSRTDRGGPSSNEPCTQRALGGPGSPLEDVYLNLTGARAGREVSQMTDAPTNPRPPDHLSVRPPGRSAGSAISGWWGARSLYEQLSFWLNPLGAFFTLGFSVIFLVLLGAIAGHSKIGWGYGAVKLVQYYLASFIAYAIMAACFTVLALDPGQPARDGTAQAAPAEPGPHLVAPERHLPQHHARRPPCRWGSWWRWGQLASATTCRPTAWPSSLTIVVGMFTLHRPGDRDEHLVPNPDAAGPMISIVFFLLLAFSGLYFPIKPGSTPGQYLGLLPGPPPHQRDAGLVQPASRCQPPGPGTTSSSWSSGV